MSVKSSRRRFYANIVFFIIGALLLFIAWTQTPPEKRVDFEFLTLQSLGLIVLTIVIVDFLWTLMGGDPIGETLLELRHSVRLLEDSHQNGLRTIKSASSEFGDSKVWMDRLRSADNNFDLMGYTLLVWTKGANFETEFKRLAQQSVKIRVLLMDPDNPHLRAFVNASIPSQTVEGVTQEIKAALNSFTAIYRSLDAKHREHLEIRTLRFGLIVTQLCRTDETLTAVQYLFHAVASRSPLLEISGSHTKLFKVYMDEFEHLWNAGAEVLAAAS